MSSDVANIVAWLCSVLCLSMPVPFHSLLFIASFCLVLLFVVSYCLSLPFIASICLVLTVSIFLSFPVAACHYSQPRLAPYLPIFASLCLSLPLPARRCLSSLVLHSLPLSASLGLSCLFLPLLTTPCLYLSSTTSFYLLVPLTASPYHSIIVLASLCLV